MDGILLGKTLSYGIVTGIDRCSGKKISRLVDFPCHILAAKAHQDLTGISYAGFRISHRAQGHIDLVDGSGCGCLIISRSHKILEIPGIIIIRHQDDQISCFPDGVVVVAVKIGTAGKGGADTDIQCFSKRLQRSGKILQKGGESILLPGAKAFKINGNAAVGIVPKGLVIHRQFVYDLAHRLAATFRRCKHIRDSVGGIHIDTQMRFDALFLQCGHHILIAVGNVVFIAALAGGGQQCAASVPGHPAPAKSYGVSLRAKLHL